MLRLFLGLLGVFALTAPARADFIITPFIVSLLTTVGVSATVAAALAPVIVTGVLVGASLLLAKRPKVPEPSDGKVLVKSATPPKQWGVGTSRNTGALSAAKIAGSTSYRVQAVHAGRISRFRHFYANEDRLEFAADHLGPAIPDPGPGYVRMPGAYTGRYMGDETSDRNLAIDWRLGLPTETPYAQMVAALPGSWTAAHRGDGVASFLSIAETPDDKSFSRRFPNGRPNMSAVGDWTIAWDPRDPAQLRNDPATWKFSDNPFVLTLDYFCSHPHGYRRPLELVFDQTADYWIAAMDACDEAVPIGTGGTEKRYIASGRFDAETPKKAVVEAYMRCCDGYLEEIGGGAVVVFAGKFYPSNFTLTDLDVIDDSVVFNRNDGDAVNTVNVKVVSNEHDYNEVEADPWIDEAAIAAGAPRRAADVNAEWSPQWRQSRRLGKIELDRQNPIAKYSGLIGLYGENLKGRRHFGMNMPARGSKLSGVWAEKKRLEDRTDTEGGWYLEAEIFDPARRYDWSIADEGAAPQVPDKTGDDEFPKPNAPTLTVVRKTAGGRSVVVISATNPPVTGWPNLTLGGEYRQVGDATWSPMLPVEGKLQCLSAPVVDGSYEAHTWYLGATGAKGDPSPTVAISVLTDITAPAPPIAVSAALSGSDVALSAKSARNEKHIAAIEARRWTLAGPFDATAGVVIDGDPQDTVANRTVTWSDPATPGVRRYGFRALNSSGVASSFAVAPDVVIPGEIGSDTFNRSDGALGSPWLSSGVSGAVASIVSNRLQATSGTSGQRRVYYHETYSAKHYAEVVFQFTAGTNSCPLAVRIVDHNNFVGARWVSTSGGQFQIVLYNAGTASVIQTAAQATLPAGVGTLSANGDVVTLKFGGATVATATLGGLLSSATKAGFLIRGAEGDLLDDARWGIPA